MGGVRAGGLCQFGERSPKERPECHQRSDTGRLISVLSVLPLVGVNKYITNTNLQVFGRSPKERPGCHQRSSSESWMTNISTSLLKLQIQKFVMFDLEEKSAREGHIVTIRLYRGTYSLLVH